MPRQRHAVLHHQAVLRARRGPAVGERVAESDGAAHLAVEIDPVQPILFVTTDAIRREVGHAILPIRGINRGYAGEFVLLLVRALTIYPSTKHHYPQPQYRP